MNWSLLFSVGKKLVVLIDPDKNFSDNEWLDRFGLLKAYPPDAIFLGGSQLNEDHSEQIIGMVNQLLNVPVIAFPGDFSHVHSGVDGALFLSLISGRNPEYLINQHVKYGLRLREQKISTWPTGYILVDGGKQSAVAYVTQTQSIPQDAIPLAVATAVAGEMLGLKAIYLEAGSGALHHVPIEMVSAVKQAISIPLIVGGGIRSAESAQRIYKAGADVIVVGNGFEQNPSLITSIYGLCANNLK